MSLAAHKVKCLGSTGVKFGAADLADLRDLVPRPVALGVGGLQPLAGLDRARSSSSSSACGPVAGILEGLDLLGLESHAAK